MARKGDRQVDIVEQEEAPPGTVGASRTAETDETIFSILADRARTRAPSHLWLTTAIGGIDAVALMIARPSLWWVSAACAAVAAYAIWGLADRTMAQGIDAPDSWRRRGLRLVRGLAIGGGLVMVIAAVLGFLQVALGNSGPPG